MQTTDANTDNKFMAELYKLLSEEQTCDDTQCLISNLPLEENSVKLVCGHKFNYNAIFNEIKYQKRPNHLETQKLYRSELKCPYCRTIQKGLLPSRENFQNIDGVNWPKKYQFKANSCGYIYKSGKRKGNSCGRKCFEKYCDAHGKIIAAREAKKAQKEEKNATKKSKLTYKILMRKKKAELIQLAKDYGVGFIAKDTKKILSNNILNKHTQLYPIKNLCIPIPADANLYQNVVITI